jgi:hypothetical protein
MHFWYRCRERSLYSLSIYRLHRTVLASIISYAELFVALCLFMVYTGKCMTRFDLQANYHPDPESLLRKSHFRLSSTRSLGSRVQEIVDQFQGSTPQVEPVPMATRKCINDFLSPSSANIRTGPKMNVGDGNFELNPALIHMVQQSPFCGKASEDANAHLQHFLEI